MVTINDEFRHSPPAEFNHLLFGDTLWVSVVDREANIFGINHIHLTNKGYGRFEALYLIDGVPQLYGNKHPLAPEADRGPWTDGRLTYAVVKPLEEIRITFDGPRYGFDLTFRGRFPVFDYSDCVNGNPLSHANYYGGHFEQGMHCTGSFEIRGGPAAGETRRIDSWSHRDHSWSDRFAVEPPWEWADANNPGHFWPSIQLPDRHINAFGIIPRRDRPMAGTPVGGFVSSAAGSQAILGATAEILTTDDHRTATAFRYELTMPGGEVIHVRTGRKYGQVKLWDRGENDLENRLDCYEPFFDFEVEETGERGYGVAEYSFSPPTPRWLV
ncbi:hypothetical protein EDM76_03715 [bacterium]|nr:MAG: hypothetical protein EDM76_03715 [bacterium]MCL4231183.1 hypothetical protein [Dehalococcoidia bacterium]